MNYLQRYSKLYHGKQQAQTERPAVSFFFLTCVNLSGKQMIQSAAVWGGARQFASVHLRPQAWV